MLVDTFIPNDTDMPQDSSRVHIITGPNASGKSCYTKQVGLLVYLAHMGSFVPAAKCVVGLTDRILTRIVSQEQVSLQQSSFMADLNQVSGVNTGWVGAGDSTHLRHTSHNMRVL